MQDTRITQLVKNLLEHSLDLKPKEKLTIEVHDQGIPLVKEIIRQTYQKGAYPFIRIINTDIQRALLMGVDEEAANLHYAFEKSKFEEVDAFMQIRSITNDSELSDIPPERRQLYTKATRPMYNHVVNEKKWVLLNYPNSSIAQKAGMSTDGFEDFYFNVCTVDYAKLHKALEPLKELMERTDRVRIIGLGTDLTFSIKGIPAIICSGQNNIPDGEIFTAPVKDSVNGVITFNTSTHYLGNSHDRVRLEFREGKIVEAASSNTKALNEVLDMDEGARYIGEFAIGVNPYILNPMNDILFDEKIAGSFHFTPGKAYDDADNGNHSTVHWDMVMIQRPEYGGGEIYFDDILIRKDGVFVLDYLKALNPENLM